MKTVPRLVVSGLVLAASSTVQSQDDVATSDTVVVTATRTPVTADDTLASVSVLTREDIERRQPRDLPDLLGSLPGVQIRQSGGVGKAASVFLRGTNSDHTLVLINGVRVGSATAGGAAIEQIPVDEIERVEVVRGPRSTLYGADAVGGVIQIFTRRGGVYVNAGGGNRDTSTLATGIGQEFESGFYSVNASTYSTGGFDATTPDFFSPDPDRDGLDRRSVSLGGGYDLTDRLSVGASLLRAESTNEFDGSQDETDNVQQVASLNADYAATSMWDITARVSRSQDDSDSRETGGNRFTTNRHEASLQNDLYLSGSHLLTLGVDYYRDEVASDLSYEETSRDNLGVFVQDQWYLGDWNLQFGGRFDDNEAYGEETTGSVAVGYRVNDRLRGFASYGTAFQAPTFNELYYPDVGFFRGNPDLKPEHSRTAEFGLKGGHFGVEWQASVYRTEIDDLLVYQFPQTENVDRARIRGAEIEAATIVLGTRLGANASWVDPRDVETDNELPRRARRTAGLTIDRDIGRASLGASVDYVGERYDDAANTTRLDAYTLVGLNAAWHFNREWTLRASLDNAFDEEYTPVGGYRGAGRTWLVTLGWSQADE